MRKAGLLIVSSFLMIVLLFSCATVEEDYTTSSNMISIGKGYDEVFPIKEEIVEDDKADEKVEALKKAKDLLTSNPFSKQGLKDTLAYEGFSEEAAEYAVVECKADWSAQAIKISRMYMNAESLNKEALKKKLKLKGFNEVNIRDACNVFFPSEQKKPEVKKVTQTPATPKPAPVTVTVGMRNALGSAKAYLRYSAFSREGLKKQLAFEGYSSNESEYAVTNCGANWKEQAVKSAKSYLNLMSFSKDGLIKQLKYEGYTDDQARYGADKAYSGSSNTGSSSSVTVGMKNALDSARNYLSLMGFSREGLIKQLKYDGYSESESKYAADHCNANWNEQAVRSAKNYLRVMSFSSSELVRQLEYDGYTHSQAVYGVNNVR